MNWSTKIKMPNQYRAKLWLEFRHEMIELDGNKCRQCQRGPSDGVSLQVHHLHYVAGKMPWDYRYSDCETLCKGCHAALHGHIRPKFGWDYLQEEDLGDLTGTCEVCGTDIRYVFWIQHPNWEPIGVGTICCDRMTGTQIASEKMRFQSRLGRFIESSRWKPSAGGVALIQKQINLEIRPSGTGYHLEMNGAKGNGIYPTLAAAKRKAFECIEDGSASEFLKKKGKL